MSDEAIPAIFLLGPWAGRRDVMVRPGVRTVDTIEGLGHYEYRDHGVLPDGRITYVGYIWKPTP